MTITESRLNEMHDAGYPLSIAHFRILEDSGEMVLTYNNSRSAEKYGKKPKYTLRGGKTVAVIAGVHGQTFTAQCSKKEPFCFKDGAYLSVSRAYAYFLKHLVEKQQGVAMRQEVPKNNSCCGNCCGDAKETDKDTFHKVYQESTSFSIICQDTNTQKFIGYVPNNDPLINLGCVNTYSSVPGYYATDYTQEIEEAAKFDTKEEAEKYLDNSTERVIKMTYKLIGQLTITNA